MKPSLHHAGKNRTKVQVRRLLRKVLLSRVLWLLVGIVAIALATDQWMNQEGGPQAVVAEWGIWAPLASLALSILTKATPLGSVLIMIANGALFPFWLAVALNMGSGILGGIIMYYIWGRGNHAADIQGGMQKLPMWFRRHAGDNLIFLSLLRIVPWVGGNVADMIAGSHRVQLRTQILSLVLGYLPGAFLYALAGAGIVRL